MCGLWIYTATILKTCGRTVVPMGNKRPLMIAKVSVAHRYCASYILHLASCCACNTTITRSHDHPIARSPSKASQTRLDSNHRPQTLLNRTSARCRRQHQPWWWMGTVRSGWSATTLSPRNPYRQSIPRVDPGGVCFVPPRNIQEDGSTHLRVWVFSRRPRGRHLAGFMLTRAQ